MDKKANFEAMSFAIFNACEWVNKRPFSDVDAMAAVRIQSEAVREYAIVCYWALVLADEKPRTEALALAGLTAIAAGVGASELGAVRAFVTELFESAKGAE